MSHKELQQILDPKRVVDQTDILKQHSHDLLSYHDAALPDVIVYPQNANEIAQILTYAQRKQVTIVPYGAGTSMEGQIIPVQGGICLDLSQMNQIIEIRPQDRIAIVEPGVTWKQLNAALQSEGLFFPITPGVDATIGGMVATNAGGPSALYYGTMKDQLLGLEVILADSTIIHTGSLAKKSSAGYNLTQLFVGSEGTLGIFSKIILRLQPIPEERLCMKLPFPTIEAACRASLALLNRSLCLQQIELLDDIAIAAVNHTQSFSEPVKPTLFLELAGHKTLVHQDAQQIQKLISSYTPYPPKAESDTEKREALWAARRSAGISFNQFFPDHKQLTTDACVPPSAILATIQHTQHQLKESGITGAIVGHVGDGNVHVTFFFASEEEYRTVKRIYQQMIDFVLAQGGTCSGEHGIGLGKQSFLKQQYGSSLSVMKTIKYALDPHGILNPGKVFD